MPPPCPNVLVVDDDPDQLFLSRRVLEKAMRGLIVSEAPGGAIAIDLLDQLCATAPVERLQVVFLDIKMPEVDGWEVLRWIRKNSRLEHVKAIMLSSSAETRDVRKSQELGAHSYLIKHPSAPTLGSILRQIFPPPSAPTSSGDASREEPAAEQRAISSGVPQTVPSRTEG